MEDRRSKSSSSSGSSTLSPLAPPFTINFSNRQKLSVFDPSIEPPYPYYAFTSSPFPQPSTPNLLSSGGVSFGLYNGDSYQPEGALAVNGVAEADWFCSQSHPFQGIGSLDDCAPIDSVVVSTEAHCAQGTTNGYGQQPELRGHFLLEKGNSGCGVRLPEQGYSTAEGLKTWGGNSSLSGNVIGSGGTTQVTTKFFLFPPEISSVSPTKFSATSIEVFKEVPRLQKQYSGPVINSWKHCDSALKPLISKNENCGGRFADSNNNSIGHIPSSIKGTNVFLNVDDTSIDKGNEIKNCTSAESCSAYKYKSSSSKPVSYDSMDPLCKEKFELQVTHSKLSDDIILEPFNAKTGLQVKVSSEMFDKSDSEVDSPCWKGTLAFRNSPFKNSGTLNSQHFKNGLEEGCSSLNPLVPQFYPCNERESGDCCEDKCFRDDLSSSSMDSAVVNLSSREHQLADAVKAGLCSPKAGSEIGPQIFSNIPVTRKEPALLKELNCSSEKVSHLAQQSLLGDYLISEEKPVAGANVAGFVKDVRDASQNDLSCVPSLVIGHVSSSPPYGIKVSTELTETLAGASNSLSTPPKLDAQTIVNAIHNLSEILVQNCSNDVYSLMEHENNTLQQVINNLYVCFKKSVGRRTPMPESSHPVTSYWPKKSTDLLEVLKEVGSAPHQHKIRMANLKRNGCFTVLSGEDYRVQDYSSPSSDSGIGKGNKITLQVMSKKVLRENHHVE
ncbi:uncharacterized protein LOC132308123 [Cornus florida]|uniref:uncharacterized protein LOC132308123 n=1 Tax=Cornus florida TaxID=4283 RepID=UPI0028A259D6|nr:uncharacterized protein LOC132308123 [Cornus florida]XP_059662101.1 uncharacterized protein LOC132308123 [Cornus florida]